MERFRFDIEGECELLKVLVHESNKVKDIYHKT